MPTTKGSWSRVKDKKRFDNNYDKIFGVKDEPVPTVHSPIKIRKMDTRTKQKGNLERNS
jgi:hypothetical protein